MGDGIASYTSQRWDVAMMLPLPPLRMDVRKEGYPASHSFFPAHRIVGAGTTRKSELPWGGWSSLTRSPSLPTYSYHPPMPIEL